MLELLLAVALGAGALSNFPRDAGGKIGQAAIGLTLDGAPVVVVAAGNQVAAWRVDGESPAGFPIQLGPGEVVVGAPAAADMEGDRRTTLAAVTAAGKVLLWSGGVLPGWPVSLGARARAGAAFADVDGDGRLELVVGDEKGRLHAFKRNGTEARGYPVQLGKSPVTSSPSSAFFAGGLSLAVGCEDGRVHVLSGAGKPRPGFPLVTAFAVTGAPVFTDLDEDGVMDLVVASQDFKLHAVDAKGQPLKGFPVTTGYRLYEGPAVADLDGDRHLDLVFVSADGMLHAVDRTGKALRGFPVKVGARAFSGAVVGDLERGGTLAAAVVLADGSVVAVSAAGKPLAGFPVQLGETDVTASPLLLDLTGDGSLALFVGGPSGRLHAIRAGRAATPVAGSAAAPWPVPGRDAAHTGRFGPNPPSYRRLKLEPAEPRVSDKLSAAWQGVWLDAAPGEAVPAPRLDWLRDGKPVAGLEGKKELPAGTARRGERWRFLLTPPQVGAGVGVPVESAELRVLDTAPTTPEARVEPAAPPRGTSAKAVVTKASTDLDGDKVSYAIDWLIDGLETGVTGETFPGDRLRRGARLTARVAASDGELTSAPALADARVANTAPGRAEAALQPARPRHTEVIQAKVVTPATDPDDDPLTYHYRWLLDGKPLPLPAGASELPAGLARKHQKVAVEVRAFDGAAEGPAAAAEVVVVDSPPAAPGVEIRPARPRKGDALRAVVAAASEDADGDAIAYAFSWTKNGAPLPVAGDGREVPGAQVARGDRFEVTVRPSDGELAGPTGGAAVTVVNTPPTAPRVTISPRHPRGGEPLRLVVQVPSVDVDGDPVKLGIAWARGGAPTGSGGETLPPTAFKKHERVRVTVTPSDGQEAGPSATDEVLVENAPPGAPVVAFTAERPTVAAPIKVTIKTPAPDPDGDSLRYRYRWRRDGALVALGGKEGGKEGAGNEAWTEVSEVPVAMLAKGQRWEVEVQAFDGETYGPPGRAAVTVANSAPKPPRLTLVPARPRRVDGLAVQVDQPPDADGDQLTHRYLWTRSGQPFEAPPDQAQIPRGTPRKGERWAVSVVALDGEAESAPARAEVVIGDTAPGAATVTLCDGPVQSGVEPEVRVVTPAVDADGDPVSYRYEWTLNGKPLKGAAGARLPQALKKHDLARVQVTPWDGELAGPAVVAECAARNTAPTSPEAILDPEKPTALTGLAVRIVKPSTDHDGDRVSYRYRWTRDGLPYQLDGALAPPRTLRHREVWRVEVVPTDGEEEGAPVVLAAVVENTAPPAPAAVVKPILPTVGQLLTCETTVPDRDVDQESVTVRYRWFRDGALDPLSEGSPVLPAGVIRRGERWKCEAWSSDGTGESGRSVAEVTVQNSPPHAPVLAVDPDPARTADDLVCRVAQPAVDPDGDEVSYAFAWWRNGKPIAPGAEPGTVPAHLTSRGDRFRCVATPRDGQASGQAATVERVISNSPPGPARVRVNPEAPRAGQPLRCNVVQKGVDPDGDVVRYRYRWQRNGTAQPFSESSEEVPGRLVRAGDRWRCSVVSTDGDQDGPESGSEEVPVGSP